MRIGKQRQLTEDDIDDISPYDSAKQLLQRFNTKWSELCETAEKEAGMAAIKSLHNADDEESNLYNYAG